MPPAVVAVGGNAISPPKDPSLAGMRSRIAVTAARLADLAESGFELVVTHGNGPQGGSILLPKEEARHKGPAMPLDGGGAPEAPAFREPTKPIGPTYESEQELVVRRAKGWRMARDPRGGWRRVVPSPRPLDVVEKDLITALLRAGNSGVLIAAGGGGVPVVRHGTGYRGVEAVIDKDLASAVLAKTIGADGLLIVA